MTVLVDSSVWIDHLRGVVTPAVLRLREWLGTGEREILTADLIVLELLRGCRSEREAQRLQAVLLGLDVVPLAGVESVVRAAALYRRLRSSGVTVSRTVDLLIASWCIHEHVALLHDDRDFGAFRRVGLVEA